MPRIVLNNEANIEFQTPDDASYFFGYYDKSPMDMSGSRLLAHRVTFDGRNVLKTDEATCGYFNLRNQQYVEIGETQCFNWQQGSMMQWLPTDYSSKIIYNKIVNGKYGSIIYDTTDNSEKNISCPIYSVHPSGDFAIGVNYYHLYFCRPGYNYLGIENKEWDQYIPDEDGLYYINLNTGECNLLIATRAIAGISHKPAMDLVYNWLEHCMWNWSGSKFAFLHRFSDPYNWAKHRLFIADCNGDNIKYLRSFDYISHYNWIDDNLLIAWSKPASQVFNIYSRGVLNNSFWLRPLRFGYRLWKKKTKNRKLLQTISGNAGFYSIDTCGEHYNIIGKGILDQDGHPSFMRNGRIMLGDTYANSEGYRELYLFNTVSSKKVTIGKFYSGSFVNDYRCDLHPRWDHSFTRVIIDTAATGNRRKMVVINVESLLKALY